MRKMLPGWGCPAKAEASWLGLPAKAEPSRVRLPAKPKASGWNCPEVSWLSSWGSMAEPKHSWEIPAEALVPADVARLKQRFPGLSCLEEAEVPGKGCLAEAEASRLGLLRYVWACRPELQG